MSTIVVTLLYGWEFLSKILKQSSLLVSSYGLLLVQACEAKKIYVPLSFYGISKGDFGHYLHLQRRSKLEIKVCRMKSFILTFTLLIYTGSTLPANCFQRLSYMWQWSQTSTCQHINRSNLTMPGSILVEFNPLSPTYDARHCLHLHPKRFFLEPQKFASPQISVVTCILCKVVIPLQILRNKVY